MLRKISSYILLAVLLLTVSTVLSAASNQTGSDVLTEKQKEEIKALVDQEFQAKKEQLKKEILEELGKIQERPKISPAPNVPDPQLKLLK